MNGMIGMIDLLLGTDLIETQIRYAQIAKSSADSLLKLINDILDFSKIESGKIELELIDFDLRTCIEDCIGLFSQAAHGKGIELLYRIGPEVPYAVRGDPTRLRQIMSNLINNALKFTEQGVVVLRVGVEDHTGGEALVKFGVSDTGIGIPTERLERLFVSFSQVDASTTRRYGGTGLGLAISKRLVERMGGQIEVQSRVGHGTTFSFTVRLEVSGLDEQAEHQRQIHPDFRGMRVLLVCENPTGREILRQCFSDWGMEPYAVESASLGRTAMHQAVGTGNPFGLIVIDVNSSHERGRELATSIKSDQATARTQVILLDSNRAEDPQGASPIEARLVKPIRHSELLETVRDLVTKRGLVGVDESTTRQPIRHGDHAVDPVASEYRILLVEDNEINQMVAHEILARSGYHCDIAATGKQALDAVLEKPYDLVLMDCQMPEMDGFTATEAIRHAERLGKLPLRRDGHPLIIVALTANAVKGDRERCIQAGMDSYLTKPLNPQKLIEVIESYVRGTSATGSNRSSQISDSHSQTASG